MRLAVLSDTHLSEPTPWFAAVYARHLAGADMVLHCGDTTGVSLWSFLLQHPRFEAVAGNSDSYDLAAELPPLLERDLCGLRLAVTHDGKPPTFAVDPDRFAQVLLNLCLNAVQAMDGGGVLSVRIAREAARGRVRIDVADTGRGIPPDNMDKLFNPFFTTKPVGQGLGIGLSTCYSIVREHHGVIEVASEVGIGTHFTVKLPLDSGHPSE